MNSLVGRALLSVAAVIALGGNGRAAAAAATTTTTDSEEAPSSPSSTNASQIGPTPAPTPNATEFSCDIVVAGGSTASFAAAITAAEAAPELTVCFTEITDWPGGQMTSGGVPAIDFGGANAKPENQPASFRAAMASIPGDGHRSNATEGSGSPGACSVSTECYPPSDFVRDWVFPRLEQSAANLRVFLRAAVVGADRDGTNGTLRALHVVQRTPRPGAREWSARLSDELLDWYSPENSSTFSKQLLTLHGTVFIEATELGDVLATAGLPWLQGVEFPYENSSQVDVTCGQAATLTFYANLLDGPVPAPSPDHPAIPGGSTIDDPMTPLDAVEFEHAWTWRRSWVPPEGNRSLAAINTGDITQQNNAPQDLHVAYLLLPPLKARLTMNSSKTEFQQMEPQTVAQQTPSSVITTKGWTGGVNLSALRLLEDRSFAWYHVLRNSSQVIDPSFPERIDINRTTSGTLHGLSKMVYWRDTRRAVGVDGFKLLHTQLRDTGLNSTTGVHFYDSVALGDYNDDVHHLHTCQYPSYFPPRGEGARPYFVPFRALQVGNAPNLLAAGKLMAQSFRANANTRLHPSEWTTGVAAGGAAVLMLRQRWTSTSQVLDNIAELQAFLNSSAIGQPLNWTGLPTPDAAVGATCALQRCLSVDATAARKAPGPVFPNGTCSSTHRVWNQESTCAPLASDEWLANADFWEVVNTSNTKTGSAGSRAAEEILSPRLTTSTVIRALQSTVLKKSTANSQFLPQDELLLVEQGAECVLQNDTEFAGYWLCAHNRLKGR